MGLTNPSVDETQATTPIKTSISSPVTSELDEYDSDCLVIIEGEEDPSSLKVTEVSTNNTPSTSTKPNSTATASTIDDQPVSVNNKNNNNSKKKSHNLPIHELKKKLAYCPICKVQFSSHKAANLCLSKHGKRQCWLCLDVMGNSKDSYFQHCVRHHAVGPSSDIVGCPYCKKFFDFRQGFNQHIVKVHFSEDISFVTSTACLSPASLVDLYTGQPRQRSDSNPNSNSNSNSNSNDYGNDIINNTFPSSCKSPEGRNSTSDSLEEIAFNPNIDGVGGFVQLVGHHRRTRTVTRESVIRETPLHKLTKPPGIPIPSYLSQPQLIPPQPPRNLLFQHHQINQIHPQHLFKQNSLIISEFDEALQVQMQMQNHQNQLNHLQSYPQVTSTTSSEAIIPTASMKPGCFFSKGSAFSKMISSSSSSSSESSLNLPHRFKSNAAVTSSMNLIPNTVPRIDPWGVQNLQSVQSFQHIQNTQNITPDSSSSSVGFGYFETLDPCKSSENSASSPLGSVSPSLLEMQRMVQSSQVQIQYFNSVNSMLRTVAECGPNNILGNSETMTEEGGTTGTITGSAYPDNINGSINSSRTLLGSNTSDWTMNGQDNNNSSNSNVVPINNTHSDVEVFKVPMNVGVKRRILTKWDEHQEKQGEDSQQTGSSKVLQCQSSSLSTRGDDFHNNCSNSMAMSSQSQVPRNGRSRPPSNMAPEDRNFWEQVIRESTAMYKGVNSQNQIEYPDGGSYSNNNNSQNHHHHRQKSIQSQQMSQYQDLKVQTTSVETGNTITTSSQSNYTERTHLYPRLMARVDSTGRPMGIFTANGQPCVLSSNLSGDSMYPNTDVCSDPVNLASQPQSQYSHMHSHSQSHSQSQQGETHSQYQYKIIPQASATSSNPSNNTISNQLPSQSLGSSNNNNNNNLELINSRKRKSFVPIRVVRNPHYDSIVIQNPFEEDDIPLSSPKTPNLTEGQSSIQGVSHPSYRSSGAGSVGNNVLEAARGQALAQWEALVRQQQQQYHQLQQNFITTGGRLHHCQPGFNAGGQITEFPLRQPKQQGGTARGHKSGKGQDDPNVSNSTGIQGISICKNSSSSSSSTRFSTGSELIFNSKDNNNSSQLGTRIQLHEDQSHLEGQPHQEGDILEGQLLSSNNNNNGLGWPPFVVAPRYQEHCHTMLNRLRDLERQRRVDMGIRYRESDI